MASYNYVSWYLYKNVILRIYIFFLTLHVTFSCMFLCSMFLSLLFIISHLGWPFMNGHEGQTWPPYFWHYGGTVTSVPLHKKVTFWVCIIIIPRHLCRGIYSFSLSVCIFVCSFIRDSVSFVELLQNFMLMFLKWVISQQPLIRKHSYLDHRYPGGLAFIPWLLPPRSMP